jgi:hypothetical protein
MHIGFVQSARLALIPSPLRELGMQGKAMSINTNVDVAATTVSLDELQEITGGQVIKCKVITIWDNGDGSGSAKCD